MSFQDAAAKCGAPVHSQPRQQVLRGGEKIDARGLSSLGPFGTGQPSAARQSTLSQDISRPGAALINRRNWLRRA